MLLNKECQSSHSQTDTLCNLILLKKIKHRSIIQIHVDADAEPSV